MKIAQWAIREGRTLPDARKIAGDRVYADRGTVRRPSRARRGAADLERAAVRVAALLRYRAIRTRDSFLEEQA